MHARALLLEVARQFVRDNKGRLLLSRAYMEGRSWVSADMLSKAKREFLEGRFIHKTVKGHRPNKASWYAITWQTMDRPRPTTTIAIEGVTLTENERHALWRRHVTEHQRIADEWGARGYAFPPPGYPPCLNVCAASVVAPRPAPVHPASSPLFSSMAVASCMVGCPPG